MRATAPTTQLEAAGVPGAAVEFPAALRRHLREKRGARRRLGRAGELLLQRRELHVGAVLDRLGLERREIGRPRSAAAVGEAIEGEGLAERFAHQLIELRAGDPFVGRGPNLLLASARHVDVELQDIGVGDEPRVPPVAGQLAIGARRFRRPPSADWLAAAATSTRPYALVTLAARSWSTIRRLAAAISWPMPAAATFALVAPSNSACSTVTAERKLSTASGMIERAEGEVGGRELTLGQQRAEDEHRLIAALPRLGDIHPGQVAGSRLRDALRRLALRGRAAAGVRVLRAGAGDGVRQGQRGLGRRWHGEPEGGHEEQGRRASYHLLKRFMKQRMVTTSGSAARRVTKSRRVNPLQGKRRRLTRSRMSTRLSSARPPPAMPQRWIDC